MSFRVTGSKLAIIPIQDSDKVGHIYIPESSKQRTDQGIVKYIGPECRDFKPGQYVIFSGHSGTIVYIQDPERPGQTETLILMDEKFIHGEIIDFEDTVVEGLYFKSRDGYFAATYEVAMEFIADAIRSASWRVFNPVTGTGIDVHTPMPDKKEYDREIKK